MGTDVAGVCQKELPSGSTLVTSDFKIVRPQIIDAKDSSFVSDMPASAISSLDLSSSEITTRQRFTFTSTNGSATVTITSTNEFFESFDEERYNVSFTGNHKVQLESLLQQ